MNYISTRSNAEAIDASVAIIRGMVPEGGLYVPSEIPTLSVEAIAAHQNDAYQTLAKWIFGLYLNDFTTEEIDACVDAAYQKTSFDAADVTPLVKLEENIYILELWHGPTAAFKDVALQILPHFLVTSLKKQAVEEEIVILVATSGDTGKAALEGFKNVKGTQIIVFYPRGGVSDVQELQMLTTEGNNTHVVAVEGNFDDCQRGVKQIFADHTFGAAMAEKGFQFSSANSINWGRLLPQIVYYFSAYLQLVNKEQITFGDLVDFSVPTGNFGNILAGWYAREMGLPIRHLICASNDNDVLTDFFTTGVYDANRDFKKTISPSMDILVSSNLERFLYMMNGQSGVMVEMWMQSLKDTGKFQVDADTFARIQQVVRAASADEDQTMATIASVYDEANYLLDTHTAVGMYAVKTIGCEVPVVIDATANPYKFVSAVSNALKLEISDESELAQIDHLVAETNVPAHRALTMLADKGLRPISTIAVDEMAQAIESLLSE